MNNATPSTYHQLRRQDRAQNDAWIRSFLKQAPYGTLATVSNGQPFLNPNLFAYDPVRNAIYLHTSDEGRTPSNVAESGPICFSASQMGRLLPARTARGFSVEYASVVVFGRAVIVFEEGERKYGLQLLLDKYFPHLTPGEDYTEITLDEMVGTAVIRIDIESWSGKQKSVPPDFPGAFSYPPAEED